MECGAWSVGSSMRGVECGEWSVGSSMRGPRLTMDCHQRHTCAHVRVLSKLELKVSTHCKQMSSNEQIESDLKDAVMDKEQYGVQDEVKSEVLDGVQDGVKSEVKSEVKDGLQRKDEFVLKSAWAFVEGWLILGGMFATWLFTTKAGWVVLLLYVALLFMYLHFNPRKPAPKP